MLRLLAYIRVNSVDFKLIILMHEVLSLAWALKDLKLVLIAVHIDHCSNVFFNLCYQFA